MKIAEIVLANRGGMMKKSYRVLLTVAILLGGPGNIYAQFAINSLDSNAGFIEFNAIGGGARAAGMGGAHIGLAQGEMAYSWNPAAMIFVQKSQMGIQLVSASDRFGDVDAWVHPDFGPNIQHLAIDREHVSLNYGGFVAPFTFMEREWAVGGGYRNIFDMVAEYRSPGWEGSQNSHSQTKGLDAISFAFAGKIIENVGAGITVNTYIRNTEADYYWGSIEEYVYPGEQDTVLADLWYNDNSHFSGANLDIGITGEFDMIRGGFVLHTPYNLVQKSLQTIYYVIPLAPEPSGPIDRVTYTYSMPLSFSAGLAITPSEKVAVAFDYEYRPLSDVDIETDWEQLPNIYGQFIDTTVSAGWEDIQQFRVGVEYTADAGFADIPIRIGFRNEPSAIKEIFADINGEITYGNRINTYIFTFGTGLHFDMVWFDLAYQMGNHSYDSFVYLETAHKFRIERDYSRLFFSTGMYF